VLRLPDYLCVDLNSPQNRFRIDTELDGEQSRELEQVPCFWGGRSSTWIWDPTSRFAIVNRHMLTSLRLIPRPSNWTDPVNTCTDVFGKNDVRKMLIRRPVGTTERREHRDGWKCVPCVARSL